MTTTQDRKGPTRRQLLIITAGGAVLAAGSCYLYLEWSYPLAAWGFFISSIIAIVSFVQLTLKGPTLNQSLIILAGGAVLAAGSCYRFFEAFLLDEFLMGVAALGFVIGVIVAVVGCVRLLIYVSRAPSKNERGKDHTRHAHNQEP